MYVREGHVYFCQRVTTDSVEIQALWLAQYSVLQCVAVCCSVYSLRRLPVCIITHRNVCGSEPCIFLPRSVNNVLRHKRLFFEKVVPLNCSTARIEWRRDTEMFVGQYISAEECLMMVYRWRRCSSWRFSFAAPTSCVHHTRKCVWVRAMYVCNNMWVRAMWVRAMYVCNNKVSAHGICLNVFHFVAFPFAAPTMCVHHIRKCVWMRARNRCRRVPECGV